MELIIVRHAVAEAKEDFARKGLEDHLRPLTLKGRKRMQKVCVKLQDHIKEFDLIVTSPLVRARQTAEILAQVYLGTKVVEVPELMPHSPSLAFLKWLRIRGQEYKRIVVVGHEPHLSSFASYMLTMKDNSFIDLKKGGVLGLELESFAQAEAGQAELLFAIPPRFLEG